MNLRFAFQVKRPETKVYVALALAISLSGLSFDVFAQGSQKASNSGKDQDLSRMKRLDEINVKGVRFKEQWPKNFPVPQYPRRVTKTSFVNTTQGAASASANLITADKPSQVYYWYKKVLERDKWKVNSPEPQKIGSGPTVYLIDGVKGHNQVTINILSSANSMAPGTSCSINWSFNRK